MKSFASFEKYLEANVPLEPGEQHSYREKDTMNFFAEQILTQRFEKFMVSKGDRLERGVVLGVWDGNATKLGCDDRCTTINVIKFIE